MQTLSGFFLLSFLALARSQLEPSPFIVNGVDTSILDHPYMAGVHVNWQSEGFWPFCGGSIITRRSILTAAHCLVYNTTHQARAVDVRISTGSSYRKGNSGRFHDVFRLIRHPQYLINEKFIKADVAVVRLVWPLIFTRTVRPIPLGRNFVNDGDMAMVTGEYWLSAYYIG